MRESRAWGGLEGRVHALVHPAVQANPPERDRHRWFIGTRLVIGAIGLAAVPIVLAMHNALVGVALVVIVGLVAQATLALWASRRGDLEWPHRISVVVLAAVLGWLAGLGGASQAPVMAILPILMLEATVLGGLRALAFTTGVTLAAFSGMALVSVLGPAAADPMAAARLFVQHAALLAASAGVGMFVEREMVRRRSSERAVEARDRLVNEGFGDLVTRHDERGAVLSVGPNAGTVLGVSPASLEERGLFERVHVADRPAYLKALADAAGPQALPVRAEVRIRVGEVDPTRGPAVPAYGWFEIRALALDPAAGDDARLVCLLRDVSVQRLQHDDLDRARRQAESASELKSRFLAMVSHELRTPLNAIIGFSDMLAGSLPRPLDDERRREYARIVRDSGQHLLGVVNTLLDISQIEAGTFPLDPEPVDLRDVLAGVTDMLRLRAEAGSVTLVSHVSPDLPLIVADRRACRQILVNLISNAVKFTPAGGTVTVTCERDGEGVRIGVSDTGIGVSQDDLGRLGEPFFQARSGHDRPFEGTGLGLSVVRGLVGLHGGSIDFACGPESGLRVRVRLVSGAAGRPEPAPVVAPFPSAPAERPAAAVLPPQRAASPDLEPMVKKRA
ncbi:sensor histidine kinase [Alsobacter sp. R-9]